MAIGLTEEHEALAASVRRFVERHVPPTVVREAVNKPGEASSAPARPPFWTALAAQGLLGLHLPEEYGGQGFSLVELAVAAEELGRALAQGPYVPTVLASAAICASDAAEARRELLPGLADGSLSGAVALEAVTGSEADGGLRVSGVIEPVLGGATADVIVLPVRTAEGEKWVAVDASATTVTPLDGLDLTRRPARVALDTTVPRGRVLTGLTGLSAAGTGRANGSAHGSAQGSAQGSANGAADVRELATVILGAEACGVAGWAVDTAVAYAKVREQFGRPIGQFQGVKHKCARMLIALEQARATVWDAARAVGGAEARPDSRTDSRTDGPEQRSYATSVAAVMAPDAAVRCAQDCIQVHGGIGYTWDHDAHLYYRRALTLRAALGPSAEGRAAVAGLALSGVRRPMDVDLPADAAPVRERIRAEIEALAALGQAERAGAMADGGWVMPHLPRPWGREATPLEQVVIHQEMRRAGVRPIPLVIGAWVVPSLVQYGTPEQRERFLMRTLRGEIVWCQLFSEPGAGSDLAGLSTRATRVEGGWSITGQKIWTSLARDAAWAICIARTDPDAPKHDGITYFLVDMTSPGIEVRPLTEMTGDAIFNQVFLDEVFVPDGLVVGEVNRGWRVARTTLANERVNLSTGWAIGAGLPDLLELIKERDAGGDALVRDQLGRLACDDHAFGLLGMRATLKQVSGTEPGATANVRKLLGMELGQQVTEYGWTLLGAAGALAIGDWNDTDRGRRWLRLLLASRAMTIGGGTTEVNLNVIGERILGLPRDP